MIERNYEKKANVERTSETVEDGVITSDFETVLENVACHIQPVNGNTTEDRSSSFGKNWKMFSSVKDIREGDRVEIDKVKYRVMEVESYEWRGMKKHLEVILRKW